MNALLRTMWLSLLVVVTVVVTVIVTLRVIWVFSALRHALLPASWTLKTSKRRGSITKTLIVLGSGGHTAEMISLLDSLNPSLYTPLHAVVAETDRSSTGKLVAFCAAGREDVSGKMRKMWRLDATSPSLYFHTVPRSREVGQSYLSSIRTTLAASLTSFAVVWRVQPDLVLCNGPGTCVPIVFSALLLKLCYIHPSLRIIYVESVCRVNTLSLSGRILYPIIDKMIVQWPPLKDEYPRAVLMGPLL